MGCGAGAEIAKSVEGADDGWECREFHGDLYVDEIEGGKRKMRRRRECLEYFERSVGTTHIWNLFVFSPPISNVITATHRGSLHVSSRISCLTILAKATLWKMGAFHSLGRLYFSTVQPRKTKAQNSPPNLRDHTYSNQSCRAELPILPQSAQHRILKLSRVS